MSRSHLEVCRAVRELWPTSSQQQKCRARHDPTQPAQRGQLRHASPRLLGVASAQLASLMPLWWLVGALLSASPTLFDRDPRRSFSSLPSNSGIALCSRPLHRQSLSLQLGRCTVISGLSMQNLHGWRGWLRPQADPRSLTCVLAGVVSFSSGRRNCSPLRLRSASLASDLDSICYQWSTPTRRINHAEVAREGGPVKLQRWEAKFCWLCPR